ncbi:type II secretion system F family protein [Streptomyces sp. NPDC089919]|uniref:type II secretion system F family protein n=1 Tax=Streptomyces sp. NPDC089919 TaxID=3155188 RepID=UPI00342863C3
MVWAPGAAWAAGLGAVAVLWSVAGRDAALLRARGVLGAGVPDPRPWRRWAAVLAGRREWGCLGVGLVLSWAGGSVLPLCAAVPAVPVARRWLRARDAARARAVRVAEVVSVCSAVGAELRAGAHPGRALTAVLRSGGGRLGGTDAVLAAAAFGGDVAGALRAAAREPGAAGLAGMAACWQVSVDGGAGLAAGLERLERGLRAERDQSESLRAQLSGARATAVVLALLPGVGLLLGTGLGADPLRVLLHTPAGFACLAAGAGAEVLGLCWVRRIVGAAER